MPPLTIFGQSAPTTTTSTDTTAAPSTTAPTARPSAQLELNDVTDQTTKNLLENQGTQIDYLGTQIVDIQKQYSDEAKKLDSMDPSDPTNYQAQVRLVDSLANSWVTTQNNYARALSERATTIAKVIDNRWTQSSQQDLWKAQADLDTQNAAKAKADATTATANAGPQRDLIIAQGTQTTAAARLADAQTSNLTAKTPEEIKQLQAQVDATKATTAQTQAATAQTQATTAGQEQTNRVLTAQADLAPAQAQATLDKAQADVNLVNQQISDLKAAQSRLPTGDQSQAAIQTQLEAAQADLATKQQALDQAKQLMPNVLAQAQANVAQTQANTAATQATTQVSLLGQNLAGAQQKVQAMKALIASGSLSPDDAAQQLQDYINATVKGTTVAEQQKQALDTETARQQTASSLAASQGSSYASMASTAGNVFSEMNKSIPQGSDLGGRAYLGMLDLAANRLRSFAPEPGAGNSPLLQSMRGSVGVSAAPAPAAIPAPAAAPAAAPTTTIAPDGTVTIAHTPTAPSPDTSGLLAPGMAGTAADVLHTGGPSNPAFLGTNAPVMPHHVDALWQNDPNLNPDAPVTNDNPLTV